MAGDAIGRGSAAFSVIAATKDATLRAFDRKTGNILWEGALPAAGFATPTTFMSSGRQYVVIACGGAKLGTKAGDSYVAFALPANAVP